VVGIISVSLIVFVIIIRIVIVAMEMFAVAATIAAAARAAWNGGPVGPRPKWVQSTRSELFLRNSLLAFK